MRFFFFLVILRYSRSHSLLSLPASLSVRFKQQHFLRVSFFLDGWMDGWTDGLWLGCILCYLSLACADEKQSRFDA